MLLGACQEAGFPVESHFGTIPKTMLTLFQVAYTYTICTICTICTIRTKYKFQRGLLYIYEPRPSSCGDAVFFIKKSCVAVHWQVMTADSWYSGIARPIGEVGAKWTFAGDAGAALYAYTDSHTVLLCKMLTFVSMSGLNCVSIAGLCCVSQVYEGSQMFFVVCCCALDPEHRPSRMSSPLICLFLSSGSFPQFFTLVASFGVLNLLTAIFIDSLNVLNKVALTHQITAHIQNVKSLYNQNRWPCL